MSSHRIGEMIFGDPPGSFSSMNRADQVELVAGMESSRQRRQEQGQKAAELVINKTVEIEGDNNE